MKISRIVDLHADAGWRVFSFLKIETDAGLIGWSEYNESYGSKGLTGVIAAGDGLNTFFKDFAGYLESTDWAAWGSWTSTRRPSEETPFTK